MEGGLMKTCTCGAVSALREVEKQYGKLHDMLSDCVESGRLSAAELTDDYAALVEQTIRCVAIDHVVTDVLKRHEEDLAGEKVFLFSIDPLLFKKQRTLFTLLLDGDVKDASMDFEPLEGIRNLLDAIADQAHDWYGMDTLFTLEGDHEP
jgi:hypothetical protein